MEVATTKVPLWFVRRDIDGLFGLVPTGKFSNPFADSISIPS